MSWRIACGRYAGECGRPNAGSESGLDRGRERAPPGATRDRQSRSWPAGVQPQQTNGIPALSCPRSLGLTVIAGRGSRRIVSEPGRHTERSKPLHHAGIRPGRPSRRLPAPFRCAAAAARARRSDVPPSSRPLNTPQSGDPRCSTVLCTGRRATISIRSRDSSGCPAWPSRIVAAGSCSPTGARTGAAHAGIS
jgi:hypothetical protein